MTSSGVPPARAPLTRRAIRAADRARTAAPDVPTGSSHATTAAPDVPWSDAATVAPEAGTAASDSATVAPGPAVSRRDLHRPRTSSRRGRRGRPVGAARWVPRAAVLGALGVLTIAAPLTGFATAEQSAEAATVETGPSLLRTLEAASARTAGGAPSLMASPGAAGRAVVQTSRSVERGPETCVPGASGIRTALRDVTLVMPIAEGRYRLSSPYGDRVDPFTRRHAQHLGSDFSAPTGTPIHAIADGTVVHAGEGKDGRSSMLVVIEHEIDGAPVYSWYVHMYPEGVHVTEGQRVETGEQIGEVGSNGRSTGPHLHLEIHLDDAGTTTDALAWLQERGAQDVSAVC